MCGDARCNSTLHSFSEESIDAAIQKWNKMFVPMCPPDLIPVAHKEFLDFLGGE